MKRTDPQTLEWQARQQRIREHQVRSDAAIDGHRVRKARLAGRSRRSARQPAVILKLPIYLNAERDATRIVILNSIGTMMDSLTRGSARVKLDFSEVKRIYPGGMLLLLAYLERLVDAFPGRIRAVCPRGSMAAQLLWHFGFGEKLQIPEHGNEPRHASVTGWKYTTGHLAEGALVHEHIADFSSQVGSSMPDGLYNTLSESMTNVRQHAYPEGCKIPEQFRRWWMFSSCQSPASGQDGNLFLAFYDFGVGIPDSMRERLVGLAEQSAETLHRLLRHLGLTHGKGLDRQLLQLAVDHTRSRTGLPFRGKGLPEMKEFAASMSGGQMTIISGRAMYRFRGHWPEAVVTKSERGILGTLILWNLPLTWKDATS